MFSDYDLTVNIEDTYGSVVETLIDLNSISCTSGTHVSVHFIQTIIIAELDGSMTASLEGDYEIVSYFDDDNGESEDSLSFTVVALSAGNDAPMLVSTPGYEEITEGDAYSATLTAWDPNGDLLSYSVIE